VLVGTEHWSGDLAVNSLEITSSREALKPKSYSNADHVKGMAEWISGAGSEFILNPWGSKSLVRIEC